MLAEAGVEPLEPADETAEEDEGPDIMELLDLLLCLVPETGNLLGDFVGRVGRPILGVYLKTCKYNSEFPFPSKC